MKNKSSQKETPVEQSARDRNPNNQGFKASQDNRSVQLDKTNTPPSASEKPSGKKEE